MTDHEKNDMKFMGAALEQAVMAFEKGEVPVGCVIVNGDRIIARAHNLVETLTDPTAHAEMQAITSATEYSGGKFLEDCTMYVTVEPCIMCAGAIGWSRIGRLVYGADEEKKGYTTVQGDILHPKTQVDKGVCREQCAKLMTSFFRNLR